MQSAFWKLFRGLIFLAVFGEGISARVLARSIDLNAELRVLEDKSDLMTIDDVRIREQNFNEGGTKANPGFGFTDSAVWVRALIPAEARDQDWFLGSQRPDIYLMEVFLFQNGKLLERRDIGNANPDRDIQLRFPSGRFLIPAGAETQVYIKVKSNLRLSLNFFLYDYSSYITMLSFTYGVVYLHLGALFALILYSFSLAFVLRYKGYFYYGFFAMSILINAYNQGGFGEVFQLPIIGLRSAADAHLTMMLPTISALVYANAFLSLKRKRFRLFAFNIALISFASIFAILAATPWGLSLRNYANVIDLIGIAFILYVSADAMRKGDRPARLMFAAWLSFLGLMGAWYLANAGMVEKSLMVSFLPIFANILEMVLITLAQATRVKEWQSNKVGDAMRARERDHVHQLLRMVCHDISNPLSLVKSLLFTRLSKANEEEMKHWKVVQRATDSIEAILLQVRRFESYSSGKASFELKSCSLRKCFEEVEFVFASRLKDKALSLGWKIEDEAQDLWVVADQMALLNEVMSNIVSNAIKFTEVGGRIDILARIEGTQVAIRVIDNGIGMPRALLDKIFDARAKTNRPGTRGEAGTGFGMPLVRTFTEMFGGSIAIESAEKSLNGDIHGTTVTLRLKQAAPALAPKRKAG